MFSKEIQQAAIQIQKGRIVVFPTETVYGLGADATQDRAVAKIFELKKRPQFNPLITHFQNLQAVSEQVELEERSRKLAAKFWPGPLTLVLPRSSSSQLSLLVTAGLQTVAVRIPSHPVALKLLQACEKPIAAPSANLSGSLSPTTSQHVLRSFGKKAPMILEGGECKVGLESTVLDLSTNKAIILRPGVITQEMIEAEIGPVETDSEKDEQIRSPGMMLKHYAPRIPIRINAHEIQEGEALLSFGKHSLYGFKKELNLSLSADLSEAAANLFRMLHELDHSMFRGIAVTPIPNEGLGFAINDRLRRASLSHST